MVLAAEGCHRPDVVFDCLIVERQQREWQFSIKDIPPSCGDRRNRVPACSERKTLSANGNGRVAQLPECLAIDRR
jgi:hypothetical protein